MAQLVRIGARAKVLARPAWIGAGTERTGTAGEGRSQDETRQRGQRTIMFAKVNMGEWWRFVDRLLRLVTMDESVAYPAAFSLNQTFGSMALPGKEMKLS